MYANRIASAEFIASSFLSGWDAPLQGLCAYGGDDAPHLSRLQQRV